MSLHGFFGSSQNAGILDLLLSKAYSPCFPALDPFIDQYSAPSLHCYGPHGACLDAPHASAAQGEPDCSYPPALGVDRILLHTDGFMHEEDGRIACPEALGAASGIYSMTISAFGVIDGDLGALHSGTPLNIAAP